MALSLWLTICISICAGALPCSEGFVLAPLRPVRGLQPTISSLRSPRSAPSANGFRLLAGPSIHKGAPLFPFLPQRQSLGDTLLRELREVKPQYSDSNFRGISTISSLASLCVSGYFGFKALPFVGRKLKLAGLNLLFEMSSPYVPLFIRRDPVLYQKERRPRIYDRFIPADALIRPVAIGRGSTVRSLLDYVSDNRQALIQLTMLLYSAKSYINAPLSGGRVEENSKLHSSTVSRSMH